MKDVKRLLPGALISIALIAAILYFVDFRTMWNAIRTANYSLLAGSAALSFLWMLGRAKVWQTLLRDKPKYIDVLFAASEGYLLNSFLPFRLGEIGRAFLLSRKSGMLFGEIIPTIVIERIVDLAFSAAILLAALPFVVGAQGSGNIGYIVGGIVIFGLAMMYVLARNNKWALDLFHKLSVRWPSLQKFGGSFLESFFQGLGVLTDGWLFLRFLFWMTLDWAIALVAYYLIILAFFPQAQPVWTLFVLGAAAFGGAIPALPGGVGTVEGAVSAALALFTGDQSTALAAALTMRLYNYLNSGILGGIGLMREGQTLSGVYQQILNFRKKEE
ncbi:lysylphosphatidylglycerol synthase transmembrane domain-containing protein [Candidatus Villigracilis saccharophilus]|uniref:lysylphosphatidylglycerol synthase transmembrane domain-containing protein n=1 Tax=Candidatus Villigracilis saccharophilus TaxID=3140684 RepID=UPI0031356D11|nr:flippase-like domain-containing protein [Anaerolineales bacterium]